MSTPTRRSLRAAARPTMQTEPAAIIGAIGTAVAAVVALLVAFGLPLTADQQAAILAVVAPVGTLVVALVIRPRVYSPASADAVAEVARIEGEEAATVVEVVDARTLEQD